jgi:hypothetical protein
VSKEQDESPPSCWSSVAAASLSQVWSDIAVYFIEGFPKVGGKLVILTVVDRFLKLAHFIPLSHPYSTSSVAKAFFDNIVCLHGMPCSIISDRDLAFTSIFWKELFRLAMIKLHLSSTFHPQTDGKSGGESHNCHVFGLFGGRSTTFMVTSGSKLYTGGNTLHCSSMKLGPPEQQRLTHNFKIATSCNKYGKDYCYNKTL